MYKGENDIVEKAMAIQEEEPASVSLESDFEKFLKNNMSSRHRDVISILDKFDNHTHIVNLYKTILYCFFHTDIPFNQMLLAHSVREFVNLITRRNQIELRELIADAITQIPTVQFSDISEKEITSSITDELLSRCHNEKGKIARLIQNFRTDLEAAQIQQLRDKMWNAKRNLEKLRHINDKPQFRDETEIKKYLEEIEDVLLSLNLPFLELKKEIDFVLDKDPETQIQVLKKVFPNELSDYFFSKLKTLESFDGLNTNNYLKPTIVGKISFNWPALPYLQYMLGQKEIEIADLINSLPFDEYKNLDYSILNGILQLALDFKTKGNLLKISDKLTDALNKGIGLPSYFNADSLMQFIIKLKIIGYSNHAFNLLKALLTLKLASEPAFASKELEYYAIPRFQKDDQTKENPLYHKLIEKSKELIKNQKDALFLLELYCDILNNVFHDQTLTTEDRQTLNWRICFRRSAIENHPQNINTNEPTSIVIDMIRDLSSKIMQYSSKNVHIEVIQLLQKGESDIFKRILLYLAQSFPNKLRGYIVDVLPNKSYFTGTPLSINVHHEYYMLLQQEFKNLPKDKQDIILKYIKNLELKEPKSDKKLLEYRKFEKLYPIHEYLPTDLKQYYDTLEQKFGKEIEHPEFLHYMSSFVGYPTPKTEEELSSMSIEQIVDFMKAWKPENKGIRSPDRSGLSDVLAKDIRKRPQEYIKHLHLFKDVSEPTYISTLLNTLWNTNQIMPNFIEICEVVKWALTKKEEKFEDRESVFDGDKDWQQVYRAAMNIFINYFHNLTGKESLSKRDINTIKDAYCIIQEITLMEDSWLKKQQMSSEEPPIEHYQRAINSLHGNAMTALFQYGIWQNRANLNLNDVSAHLEKVLTDNHYPETYAVIGRHLPWIKSMNEKWFATNLDKLLPEDNNETFDITWLCYVHFVQPYTEMYDILKKKFIYALKRNYKKTEDNSDNGGTAMHLAMYYGRGTITLEDPIFDILLPQQQETFEGVSLLSYIGRSLRDDA